VEVADSCRQILRQSDRQSGDTNRIK
jgi:hypothetical protein